jgi:hypothetical protein
LSKGEAAKIRKWEMKKEGVACARKRSKFEELRVKKFKYEDYQN